MKTILVTGSEGYIGTHFTQICKDRYRFITMDRVEGDGDFHILGNYEDNLSLLKNEEIDAILHLAAITGFHDNPIEEFFQENFSNVNQLVQWAQSKGIDKILMASTQAVYVTPRAMVAGEFQEVTTDSIHPYSMTKLFSEEYIRKANEPYIFRQSTVVGRNKKGGFFGFPDHMCRSAIQNKSLKVIGPHKKRSLILIDDLISLYVAAIEDDIPTGTYNAAFVNTTIGEAGALLASKLRERGYSFSYEELLEDNAPDVSYHASPEKVLQHFTPVAKDPDIILDTIIDRWVS